MNLFYESYPESIEVCGESIAIITDFREYIRLIDAMKSNLSKEEKAGIIIQYFLNPPKDIEQAIRKLVSFMLVEYKEENQEENQEEEKTEQEEPKTEQEEPKQKTAFSFSLDYPYILSGFYQDYRIDLEKIKYMHWWKFRFLFDGLSESTEIKQRIHYRTIDAGKIKDKEERKRVIRIQSQIALPEDKLSDYDIGDAFV